MKRVSARSYTKKQTLRVPEFGPLAGHRAPKTTDACGAWGSENF